MFRKVYTDNPCQARDKSTAARLATRSSVIDGSPHTGDVSAYGLQKQKRQSANIPTLLITDTVAIWDMLHAFIEVDVMTVLSPDQIADIAQIVETLDDDMKMLATFANETIA